MISKVPIESVSVGDSISVNNLVNTISGVVESVDYMTSTLTIRGMFSTVFEIVYDLSVPSGMWIISSYTPRKPAVTTPGVYLDPSGSVYTLDVSGRWFLGAQEVSPRFDDMPKLAEESVTAINVLSELLPFIFTDNLSREQYLLAKNLVSSLSSKYKISLPKIPEFIEVKTSTGSIPVIPPASDTQLDPVVDAPDTTLQPGEAIIGDGEVITPNPNAPDPYVGVDK